MNPSYDFGRSTWAGANVSGRQLDDSYKNSGQYRSLVSVNKPPPGSFQPTNWMTTNQIVYKAGPVIARARSMADLYRDLNTRQNQAIY